MSSSNFCQKKKTLAFQAWNFTMKWVKQKRCKRSLLSRSETEILYVFVKMTSLDPRGLVTCTYGIIRVLSAKIVLPRPTWDPHPLPTVKCLNWEHPQPKRALSTFNISTFSVVGYKNMSMLHTSKSKGLLLCCPDVPELKWVQQAFALCPWSFILILRG